MNILKYVHGNERKFCVPIETKVAHHCRRLVKIADYLSVYPLPMRVYVALMPICKASNIRSTSGDQKANLGYSGLLSY